MLILKEDYIIENFKGGSRIGYGKLVIPKGTPTTHQTACGYDENYNFIADLSWVPTFEFNGKQVKQSALIHDLTYYGLNIPREFLEEKKILKIKKV